MQPSVLRLTSAGALSLCVLSGCIGKLAVRGLPDYSATATIPGLIDTVTVYRDQFGTPHITAKNQHDVYMATGYCAAQDRLFQLDLVRRVASGRLAEVFGEDLVDVDHMFRAFRIADKSNMMIDSLRADSLGRVVLGHLEAYAEGVNQFIRAHRDSLPFEFRLLKYEPEPYTVQHATHTVGYMAWNLCMAWYAELAVEKIRRVVGDSLTRQIVPDPSWPQRAAYTEYPHTELDSLSTWFRDTYRTVIGMNLDVFSASNNWAVSGARSVTGKPLVANDMHLGLGLPCIWYPAYQYVPDSLHVSGLLLPGVPYMVVGHNEAIAWGNTNTMCDDMDFYLEKIDSTRPDHYWFRDTLRPLDIRDEVIRIKGGKQVTRTLRFTHHGPIVSSLKGIDDAAISFQWVGNQYSNEALALYRYNRAHDWESFRRGAAEYRSVGQNLVYADTAGNIGLQYAAGIPRRKKGNGLFVVPGWTGEYEWDGLVPLEELPYEYNPSRGFVVSANNRAEPDGYPRVLGHFYSLDHRYNRLRRMLESKEKLSTADFAEMFVDVRCSRAEKIVPGIVTILRRTGDERLLQVADMLDSWDYTMRPDEPAPLLSVAFVTAFLECATRDELGDSAYAAVNENAVFAEQAFERLWDNRESAWHDNTATRGQRETFEDMVVAATRLMLRTLSDRYGREPSMWQWGAAHTLHIDHPLGSVGFLDRRLGLNAETIPIGGGNHTPCAMQHALGFSQYPVSWGPSQRAVYDLGNFDSSLAIIPGGASGIPGSPHYADQLSLYLRGELRADPFEPAKVADMAVSTAVFVPGEP